MSEKRYCYLAGKIAKGHSATEYRSLVAPILKEYNMSSLDPLRGKYDIKSWSGLQPNEIVSRDLSDIDRAHCMMAVMMKSDKPSFGTPCEIMYAWLKKIPIILITNDKDLAEHPWVKSLCSKVILIYTSDDHCIELVVKDTAHHIGKWYGAELENEVYNNPTMVQEALETYRTKPCYAENNSGECGCTDDEDCKYQGDSL